MFDIKPARRTDTAKFTFRRLSPNIDKPIRLELKHLGSLNPAYVDAAFKRRVDADVPGSQFIAHDRDQDLADIAAFCAVSWENVADGGKPVECTPENVAKFLSFALANGYDDELAELRAFAKSVGNFREALPSASDLGKG